MSVYLNCDCVDGMKQYTDKYFDLAIVDPPYFSGPEKRGFYGKKEGGTGIKRVYEKTDKWEIPSKEYFKELLRVSKHQIVWGINYFDVFLGPGRIVWDKCNGESSFSDCEIAYCSMHNSVRMFKYMWNGMMQGKSISEGHVQQGNKKLNEIRIHPAQKPVNLYKWLLKNYAKDGFKILDTHVGSASSLIACHDLGFEYVGFEKDKTIYKNSLKRLNNHTSQVNMFEVM